MKYEVRGVKYYKMLAGVSIVKNLSHMKGIHGILAYVEQWRLTRGLRSISENLKQAGINLDVSNANGRLGIIIFGWDNTLDVREYPCFHLLKFLF